MPLFNLFYNYPKPKKPRIANNKIRTIKNRIIACQRQKEFYDGHRNNGYGGFFYDGRWEKVAKTIFKKYKLKENSKILHLGCDKGFLLHDIKKIYPKSRICGIEISEYAIKNAIKNVRQFIKKTKNFYELPFKNNEFDFVIAIGPVYSLSLPDAIKCLKEITRISKGKSFITLGSYFNNQDFLLFKNWTLLGTTILKPQEWRAVMNYSCYKGDYFFNSAKTLNLKKK